MKIGEPHTFCMKSVQIGCFDNGVAMARQIAIPLIIRQDKYDIRPFRECITFYCRHTRTRRRSGAQRHRLQKITTRAVWRILSLMRWIVQVLRHGVFTSRPAL